MKILRRLYKNEFINIVEDILMNKEFQRLKYIRHHHESVYEHCLEVANLSFKVAKKLNLDYISTARGALLHDFFLYDWHLKEGREIKNFFDKHGFSHPEIALKNAEKNFELNNIEKDIIFKHMFPLTLHLPRYPESWVVTSIDKYNAVKEYVIKIVRVSEKK